MVDSPCLVVQLLHDLSISAKGSDGVKLLKVIKNPVTDYLPTGCLKIGSVAAYWRCGWATAHDLKSFPLAATSFQATKCLRPREYIQTHAADRPIAFVVGAIAQGECKVAYADESISISNYAMSAAGVCAKLTDAAEEVWGVL